jgi:mannose-6-phosphate isomerase-like protein (cupin superfamily)
MSRTEDEWAAKQRICVRIVLTMKRRNFLRVPVVAALAPANFLIGSAKGEIVQSDRKSVLVKAGDDRDSKPFKFLEATFQVKVSGKDNEGRCVVFDTIRPTKVGPPLHLHVDCDEWFFVREGEFKFRAGDETIDLKTGDSLLVPRNMPHAFVKTSEGVAGLIVMHQPAGTMEEYFRTASQFVDQSFEGRQKFAEQHGMRFVGPALTAE